MGGFQPKSTLSLLEDPEDGKDDYGRAADILQGAKKKLPRPELVDRLILSVRQARPSGFWRAPAGHTAYAKRRFYAGFLRVPTWSRYEWKPWFPPPRRIVRGVAYAHNNA